MLETLASRPTTEKERDKTSELAGKLQGHKLNEVLNITAHSTGDYYDLKLNKRIKIMIITREL